MADRFSFDPLDAAAQHLHEPGLADADRRGTTRLPHGDPASTVAPGSAGAVAAAETETHLLDYVRVLYKRRWLAAAAVILTAGYILWTLQRVFLGGSEQYKGLPDLDVREWTIAIPLVVLTVALGVFPQSLLLSWMGPSVDRVVRSIAVATANPVAKPVTPAKVLIPGIATPVAQVR